MKKAKKQTVKEVNPFRFEIVENGHCFEYHKISNDTGAIQKLLIQADTNKKDFEVLCQKYEN